MPAYNPGGDEGVSFGAAQEPSEETSWFLPDLGFDWGDVVEGASKVADKIMEFRVADLRLDILRSQNEAAIRERAAGVQTDTQSVNVPGAAGSSVVATITRNPLLWVIGGVAVLLLLKKVK
ncbi:MAG: hypothetical protein RLW87_07995 [Alphaproteobacteria bacterium]